MKRLRLARMVLFVFVLPYAAIAVAAGKLEPWSGRAAPALVSKDLDGRTHDLKTHRGKVVLVNFWATWCEPCREEMPSIQRLRDRMSGKRFAVLLINVDEPDARVRRYMEETRVDLPNVMDQGKRVTGQWAVKVLPSTFLVGPDGRVRYRVIGDMDWNSERAAQVIERLLAER
jgi:thiol-disulfide isomerase/thioredoxin